MNDDHHSESLPVDRDFLFRAAERALTETFDVHFEIWVVGTEWTRWTNPEDETGSAVLSSTAEPRLAEVLSEAIERESEPRLVEQGGEGYLVVIPILERGSVAGVATATFATGDPVLLAKLARSFVRDFSAQQQIEQYEELTESYNVQMSDDFEELMFLRNLTEHLELTKVTKDLVHIAKTMLPLLRRSIKSESVAMVVANPRQGDESAAANVGGVPVWIGPQVTDEQTCRALVDRYREDTSYQIVVRNRFDECAEGQEFPGVREFILVPIARGNHLMGWLLALNRVHRHGWDDILDRRGQQTFEFGTGEATLLDSAASMLAVQGRNMELFREKETLLTTVVRTLVSAIEAKDPYTCGHSERVALYADRLAWEMGCNDEYCEKLYLTGLLHDVGKIGISDATLHKPGKLTDEEYDEIKQHPDLGWAILHDLDQLRYVFPGVIHHHERIDGRGYPDGLTGDDIPMDGRILAVADAYDAMTSDRPYRKGIPQEKATAILHDGAGTQWDAQIVKTFLEIMPDIVKLRLGYQRPDQPKRQRKVSAEQSEVVTLDISDAPQSPSLTH